MRDLMIDIETLGNRPNSIILSIGATVFDAATGELGETFYVAIDAESAAVVGLTTDVSTTLWWMRQSDAAREAAFSGKTSIGDALVEFGDFVRRNDPSHVWAKPPSFDLVLIEAAFRTCGVPIPWHYSTHRDCRTIFHLAGVKPEVVGTAHNALDDAKAQAAAVIEAYRKISHSAPPQKHVTGIEEGLERAARYIEKQRDEYVQEYGMYDGTTGVTEFSNGGEEYLSTLEELIDGIRALATMEGSDR